MSSILEQAKDQQGGDYIVNNFVPPESNIVSDSINQFVEKADSLKKRAGRRASIFKFLEVTTSLMVMLLGGVVAFVSLADTTANPVVLKWIVGGVGILIGLLEGTKRMFRFGARGSVFEQVKNKAFHLSTRARRLNGSKLSEEDILGKLDAYWGKIEILDMSMYNSQYIVAQNSNQAHKSSSDTRTGTKTFRINDMGLTIDPRYVVPARGETTIDYSVYTDISRQTSPPPSTGETEIELEELG